MAKIYDINHKLSIGNKKNFGKDPRHREPLVRGLRCLGKVWREDVREMVKRIRAGGLGGRPPAGRGKKDWTHGTLLPEVSFGKKSQARRSNHVSTRILHVDARK